MKFLNKIPYIIIGILLAISGTVYAASILTVPAGGTGAGTFPVKSLIVSNSTKATGTLQSLAAGTNGQCLTAQSGQASGFQWATCGSGGSGTNFFSSSTNSQGLFIYNNTGTAVGINSTSPVGTLVVQGISGSTTPVFIAASSTGNPII